MKLRAATLADLKLLQHCDEQPHVISSDPNDDWHWEADLGRGYGTTIMRMALERSFAVPSVTAVINDPLATNERAHRFYERLGFRFVERRQFGLDECFVCRLERSDYERGP
jgi:aminoglycoside 6'-N-acetyltransferase